MTDLPVLQPKVAIIGGGPAGLNAATVLAGKHGIETLVVEREKEAGGIPRHADHPGYGIRDRKSFSFGPKYAKNLVKEATEAGAEIRTRVQVTGWADDNTLVATSPEGRILIRPDVFLFATGARERPRPARMIPGARVEGIYTTGQLQNAVHIHNQKIGTKAVVVGAELVSWSAVLTLKEAKVDTVALVSKYDRPESYALFNTPGKILFQTKVLTKSEVVRVNGKGRVSSVDVQRPDGSVENIECDTVVFTGDWIADNELLRMAGIELDPKSTGALVDENMQTSKPNVFAVGNLNHPVETADVVSLEGQFVATRIIEYLAGKAEQTQSVRINAGEGLKWVSPGIIHPGGREPARGRLVAWAETLNLTPKVTVSQGGREIKSMRPPWPASPGRAFRIPSHLLADVKPGAGDVTIDLS